MIHKLINKIMNPNTTTEILTATYLIGKRRTALIEEESRLHKKLLGQNGYDHRIYKELGTVYLGLAYLETDGNKRMECCKRAISACSLLIDIEPSAANLRDLATVYQEAWHTEVKCLHGASMYWRNKMIDVLETIAPVNRTQQDNMMLEEALRAREPVCELTAIIRRGESSDLIEMGD